MGAPVIAMVMSLAVAAVAARAGVDDGHWNRLAAEDSSYLRAQSASPVEWQPWGPEAFAEAERTGRPLFVSIGYFSCVWTSVMDRGVFQDAATAGLLNAGCVNVKIDRFERPDLDRLYMRHVEATRQRGGWPLNLWLSPDRLPVRAAASMTAVDAGQGSFPLEAGHTLELWAAESPHLRAQARIELEEVARATGPALAGALALDEGLLESARGHVLGQFDPVHGGFGRVPKFPSPARLAFVGGRGGRDDTDPARAAERREVVAATLDGMARGGLRDHLGGGFFRYALDEGWRRPYFEKMALDQALMAESFLLGHRLTGRADFAEVARETLDYATRELGHPDGGFYNAEHGESLPADGGAAPQEGAYYVWTRDQVRHHAGAAADLVELVFDIRERGNLPPGSDPFNILGETNVLSRVRTVAAAAERLGLPVAQGEALWGQGRESLRIARQRRPRPALDRLLITQMNAAMISACCRAGVQWDDPGRLERAVRCAEFLQSGLWDASTATLYRCRLDRAPRHLAVAEDHAYLVRALLDLHEATGEFRWLRWAAEVQTAFDRHHADPVGGGYFDGRHDSPDLPVALKTIDDVSAFSPNAVAGLNLVRWSVLLQDPARADMARRLLGAFAVPVRARPGSVAGLLQVAEAVVHPAARVILVGPPGQPEARAARARLAAAPPGRWQVLTVEDAAARQWLAARQALPPAVVDHPVEIPAFFLVDGSGVEKGPFPMLELDKTLRTFR
jgi:uncharacterized protein YyaL (SSP411 family)